MAAGHVDGVAGPGQDDRWTCWSRRSRWPTCAAASPPRAGDDRVQESAPAGQRLPATDGRTHRAPCPAWSASSACRRRPRRAASPVSGLLVANTIVLSGSQAAPLQDRVDQCHGDGRPAGDRHLLQHEARSSPKADPPPIGRHERVSAARAPVDKRDAAPAGPGQRTKICRPPSPT